MSAPLVAAPEGYEATREAAHASSVLHYLLTAYPNTVVTSGDVCRVLGFKVGHAAVSHAARRLRAGTFGLNIHSQRGTGYVLLAPVPCRGRDRCANCASRSLAGACTRLKGRPVGLNDWCWGWSQCWPS